jgi:cyclopropane fatty-acyl-phospholipid synthase-like methyltransferase
LVTATDNIKDYWEESTFNRHFYIINDDITHTNITKRFDFITCISVLEHIQNHDAGIQGMFSLLNEGGHLVLSFPHNKEKFEENIYKHPEAGYGNENPYICKVFSQNNINSWVKSNNGKVVSQEYWQIFSGDFWTFGERLCPPRQVNLHERHQLCCILIQKEGNSHDR